MMRKRVQAHLSDPYIVQDDRNLGVLLDLRLKCDEDMSEGEGEGEGEREGEAAAKSYCADRKFLK